LKKYRDIVGFTGTVVTDPTRAIYTALNLFRFKKFSEMKYHEPSEYTKTSLAKGLGYALKISILGRFETGDAKQQAGTFVLGKDGKCLFHYFEKHSDDHPKIELVFRAAGAVNTHRLVPTIASI